MVSVRGERSRDGKSAEPHLGLGLYVARLIAEFHGGSIRAENLASGGGVAVTATFRLA
jgi:signal transduction histidine kinase